MIKNIIRLITVLIIVGAGAFVAYKMGWFKDNELKIDKTANVVEEIKKIGEFTSACYYEELVVKQSKKSDFNESGFGKLAKAITDEDVMDEIVIIANGKVRAGFDLTKLKDGDIQVHGDTLSLTLPETEIFDVIINPSGYEVYVEDGTWSHEEVTTLVTNARKELKQNAVAYQLEKKAEDIGITKLKALFSTFGFNTIFININKELPSSPK